MAHDYETKSRLVAKVLRDLLRTSSFSNLGDLTDALKARLSELGITTSPDDISAAYAMVESNTPIAALPAILKPNTKHHPQIPDTPTFNKSEAAQIYRQLLAKFRAEQPQTATPGAPEHFPTLIMVR